MVKKLSVRALSYSAGSYPKWWQWTKRRRGIHSREEKVHNSRMLHDCKKLQLVLLWLRSKFLLSNLMFIIFSSGRGRQGSDLARLEERPWLRDGVLCGRAVWLRSWHRQWNWYRPGEMSGGGTGNCRANDVKGQRKGWWQLLCKVFGLVIDINGLCRRILVWTCLH